MWKRKKLILVVALAAVVLAGSLTGVAFAFGNGNGDEGRFETHRTALMEKVSEIYALNTGNTIDSEQLGIAFAEAQQELRIQARESFKERLLAEGKITEEQLEEFETWRESRPEGAFPRFGGRMPFGFHRVPGPFGPCPLETE